MKRNLTIYLLFACLFGFSVNGLAQETRKTPSMSQDGNGRSPEIDPLRSFDGWKRKYKEGQRLILESPSKQKVLVAFATAYSIREFQDSTTLGDEYGTESLIKSGKLIPIETGTMVLVLRESYHSLGVIGKDISSMPTPIIKARILNGKHKNKIFYFLESTITEKDK